MKKCDCGCASGCRLDMEHPKGQGAMQDFRRKHPESKPGECAAQTPVVDKECK
ncbi:MAG: hypothetical protein R6W92_03130 [Desulfocurvibacter africanus]